MSAVLSFVASIVVVLAWQHDHLLGVRVCGTFSIVAAGYSLYRGRIPVLFGQRHVGNVAGSLAFVLSLAGVCLGALLLVCPELFVTNFDPIIEYAPWKK